MAEVTAVTHMMAEKLPRGCTRQKLAPGVGHPPWEVLGQGACKMMGSCRPLAVLEWVPRVPPSAVPLAAAADKGQVVAVLRTASLSGSPGLRSLHGAQQRVVGTAAWVKVQTLATTVRASGYPEPRAEDGMLWDWS